MKISQKLVTSSPAILIPNRHLQRLVAAFSKALDVILPLDVVGEIAAAVPARAKVVGKRLADLDLRNGEQVADGRITLMRRLRHRSVE